MPTARHSKKPVLPPGSRFQVHISPTGRLVLPAAVRRQFGLAGAEATLTVTEEGISISTRRAARHAARQRLLDAMPPLGKRSMVDELIAERRIEAAREALRGELNL